MLNVFFQTSLMMPVRSRKNKTEQRVPQAQKNIERPEL